MWTCCNKQQHPDNSVNMLQQAATHWQQCEHAATSNNTLTTVWTCCNKQQHTDNSVNMLQQATTHWQHGHSGGAKSLQAQASQLLTPYFTTSQPQLSYQSKAHLTKPLVKVRLTGQELHQRTRKQEWMWRVGERASTTGWGDRHVYQVMMSTPRLVSTRSLG